MRRGSKEKAEGKRQNERKKFAGKINSESVVCGCWVSFLPPKAGASLSPSQAGARGRTVHPPTWRAIRQRVDGRPIIAKFKIQNEK